MCIIKTLYRKIKGYFSKENIHYIANAPSLPEPFSKDEEEKLVKQLAKGDKSVIDLLITHNLRLVVYIAKKFENSGVQIEDLISIGTIGLIKAVHTFRPEKKIKLATYASRCIENEILMYLRKNGCHRGDLSFDEPLNVDWDGNELLLSDIMGSDPNEIHENLESNDEKCLLLQEISRLPTREKMIMCMRFGLGAYEEHTQKEVADLLGISQSYISRLEKKILTHLKIELEKLVS